MFCPKCGSQIPDGSAACPACGANLSGLPNVAPQVPSEVPAAPEELPTQVVPEMAPTTVLPSEPEVNAIPVPAAEDRTEVRPFVNAQPEPQGIPVQPTYTQPEPQGIPVQPTYTQPDQGFVPQQEDLSGEYRADPQFVPAPAPAPTPASGNNGGGKGGKGKIIGIAVAIAAVVGIGAFFGLGGLGGGDNGGGNDNPPATTQEAPPENDFSEYVDANGNPTGAALLELDGATLADLLQENDYSWSSRSDCWLRQSDLAAVYGLDSDLESLSKNDLAELKPGAQGEAIVYVDSLGGYNSVEEAFDGAIGMDVDSDDVIYGDGGAFAHVSDSRGNEYIVYVNEHGDGTFDLVFFNEDAIAAGLLDSILGADLGDTASAAWAFIQQAAASGGSGGNSGGGSSTSANAVMVDDNHNITAAACVEMSGSELANEMANWGYSWSDGSTCFLRGSDRAALGGILPDGLMGESDMRALKPGAEGTNVILINSVGGYSSVQDAFKGALGYSSVESIDTGDTIFCKLESSTGHAYVCVVVDHEDGTFDFLIFNDATCSSGLFAQYMGADLGSSASEVWSNIVAQLG